MDNNYKNENKKLFNKYVFLSSFSRNLIEVFIGIILLKGGFNLNAVILYYLISNILSLILTKPFLMISKKYSNRVLAIIGVISFILLQVLLNKIYVNYFYLILVSSLYAIYRRGYWISRRFYNLKIIQRDNIASSYSLVSIVNQLAVVTSSYIGSLLLDFINIFALTFFSICLFLVSIIFLYQLKFTHEFNDTKIDLVKCIKKVGFSNIYLMSTYELLNVVKFFFPLYIYIYVKNTYQVIGIVSLIQSLATIIFSYIYGRVINKDKNYLKLSIILVVCIYILKANSFGLFLFFISFLEGFATKMYEISINKNFYTLSKKLEYYNYNYLYEFMQNLSRSLILLVCYFFIKDIRIMIYFTLIFMFVGVFFNFNSNIDSDYKID